MSDEKSIDNIVHEIEALLASSVPYDVSLNDDELKANIRRNKSFVLEGLKKEVSEERILKMIRHSSFSEDSDTAPILQSPETVSEVCDVQDTKQKQEQEQEDDTMFKSSLSSTLMRVGCVSDELIIVRWDEIDSGDYYGETQFCESWEEAIDYMVKTGRKKYEIEIGVEEEGE